MMGDILPPKRQAVVERLKRRIEFYRRHQNASFPRYDQAANGLFDQQKHDTLLLKQRYLESKAKKAKKSDHKGANAAKDTTPANNNNSGGGGEVQQRSLLVHKLKRPAEGSPGDEVGPTQAKVSTAAAEAPLPSFSVQIVQQFTSNASSSSQGQHSIQTNVTVKAVSNVAEVECKQERVEDEFAACGEDTFAQLGFPEDSNDDEIHPDILKDLFDDDELFTNHTDLMKDFNFEDSVKELDKVLQRPFSPFNGSASLFEGATAQSFAGAAPTTPSQQQQRYFADFKLREPSPAAQTLKQMAEQHQSMQQLGLFVSEPPRFINNGQGPAFSSPGPFAPLSNNASGNNQVQQPVQEPPVAQQKQSPYAATRPLSHYSEPMVGQGQGTASVQAPQQPQPPPPSQQQQQQQAIPQAQFQAPPGSVHMSQQIQIQGQQIQVSQAQQISQEIKTEVVYPRYGQQQQPTYQMSQSQSVTFNPQQQSSYQHPQQRQMQQFMSRPPPPEYKGTLLPKPQQRYQPCGPSSMRPTDPITPEMLYAAQQQQQQMASKPQNKPPVYAHPRHRAPNVNVGPDGLGITQRLPSIVPNEWRQNRPPPPPAVQRMYRVAPPVQTLQQQQQVYARLPQPHRPPGHPSVAQHQHQQHLMIQQQQQQMVLQNQQMAQQQQQHQVMYGVPSEPMTDSSANFNLDFLDGIDGSASDLLNFDQVMQGGAHFNLLEEMGMLGK